MQKDLSERKRVPKLEATAAKNGYTPNAQGVVATMNDILEVDYIYDAQLAERLGVSHDYLYRYCQRKGIVIRPSKRIAILESREETAD